MHGQIPGNVYIKFVFSANHCLIRPRLWKAGGKRFASSQSLRRQNMKRTRSDFVVVTRHKRRLPKEPATGPETPAKTPGWVELLERQAAAPLKKARNREADSLFAAAAPGADASPRILPSLKEARPPAEPQVTPTAEREPEPAALVVRRKAAPKIAAPLAPAEPMPAVAPASSSSATAAPRSSSRRRERRLDRHELPPGQRWKRLLPAVLQTR